MEEKQADKRWDRNKGIKGGRETSGLKFRAKQVDKRCKQETNGEIKMLISDGRKTSG